MSGQERRNAEAGPVAPPPHVSPVLRLRLTVAIPLLVTFLVMLSGFVALWISYPLFFEPTRPHSINEVEARVMRAFLAVGGFTLVSLVAALVLAYSIARPLRVLTNWVASLRQPGGEGAGRPQTSTEIGALGSALEGVASSVSSLRLDSYTLHSLEGGVVTANQAGIVTSINAVAEKILGCAAAATVGRPLADVLPRSAENRAFLEAVLWAPAGAVRASSAEAMVRTPGGRSVQLGYTLSPLRDETGRSLGSVLTFKDLAEHKHAEQVMRRAENLALLGTMATSVAHEVRNPLGGISGLVELIRDGLPADSPHRRYTERIMEDIERINRICRELLTIGHPEPRTIEAVNLNELVRSTIETCRYDRANQGIEVEERYAPGLPPIQGDRERLSQVVYNILRNAFQAVRRQGAIAVTTLCSDAAASIAIHNTGPPIPPDVQERLFTLFFTTKPRGTGLGLAVSQQLVRAHGGRILADSGPDQGTTFTIELPLVGPARLPEPQAAAAEETLSVIRDA